MNTSSVVVALSVFFSLFYLSTVSILEVQCAAIDTILTTRHPIVYRRYVRRRPPMQQGDQYVEEFVEVFHTQHKPPAVKNPLSDEDVDKFLFCDFHRETDECKLYWNSKNHRAPIEQAVAVKPPIVKPILALSPTGVKTTKTTTTTSTTTTTTTAAKTPPTTFSTTGSPSTSSATSFTTTTTSSPLTSSASSTIYPRKSTSPQRTTTISAAGEVIQRIPDISFEEDNDVDDNADDYDETNDNADEEDQEDQYPSTTTLRNPFNFFRF